ncbi:uncharacterized protein [Dermacentor albipictus]|uniref:uncharacterized protein isoform X4 n=1 Tax=Dermacentor albipictus TaxID=60249 RepID=UPI0038FD0100
MATSGRTKRAASSNAGATETPQPTPEPASTIRATFHREPAGEVPDVDVGEVDVDIRRLLTAIPPLYRITREQAALRRRSERKRKHYLLCAFLLVVYMIILMLLLFLIHPPERPKKLQYPLLCTTSSEAYVEATADLPADGICTFIFYDSAYKNGDHPFVNRPPPPGDVPFDIDLGHFARRHFLFIQTLLGMSFALDNGHLLKDYETPEFRRNLDYTWKEKIYQYGVVNMRPPHITKNDILDALTVIKSLDTYWHLKPNFSDIQPSTALGIPLPENQWPELLELLETFFTPHIFIAISHVSIEDHSLPECLIMPTSIYSFPANVTARYFQSVNDSGRLLQMIWDRGILSALSFSFTMKARWYRPRHPDPNVTAIGNFGLFNPCMDPGVPPDISPGKACNVSWTIRNNSRYDPTYFVRIGYDKTLGRTLVFDPLTGMRIKICTAKRIFLRVNFTVSAYDVEYDVWRYARFKGSVKCDHFNINGTSQRTQFLENIRGFLNRSYVAAPDVQDCITHW